MKVVVATVLMEVLLLAKEGSVRQLSVYRSGLDVILKVNVANGNK